MPNEFYKRSTPDKVSVTQAAVAGPNRQQEIEGNARRTQSIISGLNGLVSLGAGIEKAADTYAAKKTKEATAKGTELAQGEKPRPDSDFWSGDAGQEAYDSVKAENTVKQLPAFVDQYITENGKKPLDEMSADERRIIVAEARGKFFDQDTVKNAPHRNKAEAYANEVVDKQLSFYDNKAKTVGAAKAKMAVEEAVSGDLQAFGGSSKELDDIIDAKMLTYQQVLTDPTGEDTQTTVVSGLVSSVMSDSPDLNAMAYLKSPEAKNRFGHLEGFDKAVKQANDFSLKAQNAAAVKARDEDENGFYGVLSAGGFTTVDQVRQHLDGTVLDEKDKFSLMNKAVKHMKLSSAADNLQQYYDDKNFGVINSASQEDLGALFERNVMPKNLNLDAVLNADASQDPQAGDMQNNFAKWVKEGHNVPKYVSEHLNSNINAGNTVVWNNRLATYQRMSQRLGATGLAKLYTSDTQAALEEYAALSADVVMKPEDKKQALTNFLEGSKQDRITGFSTNYAIRKEIIDEDKGILGELTKFAAEGGGDTTLDFDVPADLQPFTTTRNNSDTSTSGYAVKSLVGNYSIYRRQNPSADPQVALRKAKNDFLSQNVWVDWADKSTYVPREFGENFAERGMSYIRDSGVISRLAVSEGLPPEVIERKVTIEPSSDYHSSRKLSIFYDGIEQSQQFTLDQFDKKTSLLSSQERMKIERENKDVRNSPEYKARQEKLMKMQKSLRTFGFGMN